MINKMNVDTTLKRNLFCQIYDAFYANEMLYERNDTMLTTLSTELRQFYSAQNETEIISSVDDDVNRMIFFSRNLFFNGIYSK